MITPNCTITVPTPAVGYTTDGLGNPVPNVGTPIEIKAWLHEIEKPKTEDMPGVDRDMRLLRGHTVGSRPTALQNGLTVTVAFTDGRSGQLTIQDRTLGAAAELRELIGGDQLQGYFKEHVQR